MRARDEYEVWTWRKDGDLIRRSDTYLFLEGAIEGAIEEAASAPEGERYEVEVRLFRHQGGSPTVVFDVETDRDQDWYLTDNDRVS